MFCSNEGLADEVAFRDRGRLPKPAASDRVIAAAGREEGDHGDEQRSAPRPPRSAGRRDRRGGSGGSAGAASGPDGTSGGGPRRARGARQAAERRRTAEPQRAGGGVGVRRRRHRAGRQIGRRRRVRLGGRRDGRLALGVRAVLRLRVARAALQARVAAPARARARRSAISSRPSHACSAERVRWLASLTTSRSTQSEIRGSRSGTIDVTGGIGCVTWRISIATGVSTSWNGVLPGEQLERHAADRVEVGPRPDLLGHRLLGRDVGGRADGHPGRGLERAGLQRARRLGDPEVGDLHAAVPVTRTFSGFRSRCTMSWRSAADQPGSTPSSTPLICARFICPRTGAASPAPGTPSRGTACRRARSSRRP